MRRGYLYEIDSERRLIAAEMDGDVTPEDFVEFIRAEPRYVALYDRLLDGRGIRSVAMDSPHLMGLASAIHAVRPHLPTARTAVVVPVDVYRDVNLIAKMLARVGEIHVFLSMDEALRWLRRIPEKGR